MHPTACMKNALNSVACCVLPCIFAKNCKYGQLKIRPDPSVFLSSCCLWLILFILMCNHILITDIDEGWEPVWYARSVSRWRPRSPSIFRLWACARNKLASNELEGSFSRVLWALHSTSYQKNAPMLRCESPQINETGSKKPPSGECLQQLTKRRRYLSNTAARL